MEVYYCELCGKLIDPPSFYSPCFSLSMKVCKECKPILQNAEKGDPYSIDKLVSGIYERSSTANAKMCVDRCLDKAKSRLELEVEKGNSACGEEKDEGFDDVLLLNVDVLQGAIVEKYYDILLYEKAIQIISAKYVVGQIDDMLNMMRKDAKNMGANALVGIKIDQKPLNNGMLLVATIGTPINIKW